jgi:hypothetical protein
MESQQGYGEDELTLVDLNKSVGKRGPVVSGAKF